jgi:hypothetical protein
MSKANQAIATEIDWDAVEGGNTDFTIQYPRLQWVHGEAKASGINQTGGLFIAAEVYPDFTAKGFKEDTLVTREGDKIKGYAAAAARLAVIRLKLQWVKNDEERNVPLVHALVVIEGCDDTVCLSLKGPSKALAFKKAFEAHMAQNVSLANRTRPSTASALEPFALWFPLISGPLASAPSKDGKAKSVVTYPELATPETLDLAYVRSLWVGADRYSAFAGIWRETTDWQKLPIWEQREASDDDLSDMTGGGEPASREQLEHLVMLCEAKGFNEQEVMNGITHGARSKFIDLTKAEARQVIDELKVK